MKNRNYDVMLRNLLLIVLIAAAVLFVLFGEEILQWLFQEMDASTESNLRQILG